MNLQTVSNTRALAPKDKIRLLELQEMELQLEQESRRRKAIAEANEQNKIIGVEGKHKAFIAAYPFREFVREAFSIVEPSITFQMNWHIDIISELLQATVTGDVRNYIINQPRRTMKSLLACVMFPAWVWTYLPHLRFLFTSYSKDFAKRDNEATGLLINSDWYQNRFGHVFMLTTQRKDKLQNNRGGKRIVFRIGKGVGEGGDFVIADDPNDIEEVESEIVLEKTNRGYAEISSQNVTDRRTAVRGNIQQRTAPNDLTGFLRDNEKLNELFTAKLCLPNRFEEDHPDTNTPERPLRLGFVSDYDKSADPSLEIGGEKVWIDPRCKEALTFDNIWYRSWYKRNFSDKGLESRGEGQLLWEDYIGEQETADAEALLGNYGTSAQMQQRPIRRGGNFFNSAFFPEIDLSAVDLNNMIFMRYWDMAGTDNDGDWTVGTLIGRTKKRPYKYYIVDMFRAQLSYEKRMEELKRISLEDFQNYVLSKDGNEYSVGIEREGGRTGKDISYIEKEELEAYNVWMDFKKVSKESRAKVARLRSEGGNLFVVRNPIWNSIFYKRLEKYNPLKKNQKDDEIDTLGACIYYLAFSVITQNASTGGYY